METQGTQTKQPAWWKPGIEATGSTCLCCPTTTEQLRLETKLYNGYGGWIIRKNGQLFFAEDQNKDFDECRDLTYVETIIGEDNDENEYIAYFESGLRDATYQRHAKNTWVLIGKGPGYA